jgi:hypothetical protein
MPIVIVCRSCTAFALTARCEQPLLIGAAECRSTAGQPCPAACAALLPHSGYASDVETRLGLPSPASAAHVATTPAGRRCCRCCSSMSCRRLIAGVVS